MQKLKKIRRKQKNNRQKQNKNIKNRRDTKHTEYPAHEPPRQIHISKGLAGRFMFFLFFCFPSSCSVFCFYMCFVDCKCKGLKRLSENRKTERNRQQHIKTRRETQKQQKYRISSPRTSANKSHKLFAEVRGLDILYLCFYFYFLKCFPSSFLFFFMFLYVFCFRLVFLSFCIYNRQNT